MKQSKSLFNPLDYPSIFGEPSRLTNITSWHEHIPFAFWIVAILQPKTFVELGTHKGDSYGAFCQAVAQLGLPTRCYAVDTWKGDEHAGFYEEDVFTEFKTYHDQQYGQFSQLIRSTFDEALEHFSGGSIDLLHIDGLHTYNAVRHDLDCWLPKMSRKGVLLLHDTNVHERGFDVWKLWKELKEQFPSFEFTHGHGLGILMAGKVAPEKLNTLLAARKEVKENVRKLFYLLGNRVALQRSNDQLQQALAERDGQVANLNQAAAERDGRIANLNQAVAHRDERLAGLQQDLAGRDRQIRAYENSTSWRVTAPLRFVSKSSRLFFRVTRAVVFAVKRYGIIDSIRRAFVIISRGDFQALENAANRFAPDNPLPQQQLRDHASSTGAGENRGLRSTPRLTVTDRFEAAYNQYLRTARVTSPTEYVEFRGSGCEQDKDDVKLIAFYLPQYHPIPINDEAWGRGFTEWTNVSKGAPQFVGHYQPRLPGELGFYDLRLPQVQERQVELARHYGIHGFCFHYYWFSGKRLLDLPLTQFINNKNLDFPFCICWANENWTRRWDGQEQEVIIAQQHSPENDIRFIKDIESILRNPRYMRIGEQPLLLVYRPALLPNARETTEHWRAYCLDRGLASPFLVMGQTFGDFDPRPYGFDAAVQFPPHSITARRINEELEIVNPAYSGNVYDYPDLVRRASEFQSKDYKVFRTVMPGWDNEARVPGRGNVFHRSSPAAYRMWLELACDQARTIPNADERIVFINAWNEWAESAYLEPDRRFGYAYLQATADALKKSRPLVSVVMPAYNHEKFVDAALESIRRQTYDNIELIIINDGSTDGTWEVIGNFVARNPNLPITAITQANAGSHSAIRRGIELSSGNYVALMNSDDLYAPDRISRMLSEMDKTGAELAFSSVTFIDDNGYACHSSNEIAGQLMQKVEGSRSFPELLFALLDSNIAISTGNLIFTRSLYERLGGFRDLRLCHDWDFLLQASLNAKVVRIDEPLYQYRVHNSNTFRDVQDRAEVETRLVLTRFFEAFFSDSRRIYKKDPDYFWKFIRDRGYQRYFPGNVSSRQEVNR